MILKAIDTNWRQHLSTVDDLRQGIQIRGYAQKDPKQEYKREAFDLFSELLDRIRDEAIKVLLTVRIQPAEAVETEPEPALENIRYHHADYDAALAGASPAEIGRASCRERE